MPSDEDGAERCRCVTSQCCLEPLLNETGIRWNASSGSIYNMDRPKSQWLTSQARQHNLTFPHAAHSDNLNHRVFCCWCCHCHCRRCCLADWLFVLQNKTFFFWHMVSLWSPGSLCCPGTHRALPVSISTSHLLGIKACTTKLGLPSILVSNSYPCNYAGKRFPLRQNTLFLFPGLKVVVWSYTVLWPVSDRELLKCLPTIRTLNVVISKCFLFSFPSEKFT